MEIRINEAFGWLDARYDIIASDLEIRYYSVHQSVRGRGFGTRLLQLALETAVDAEARSISGHITSRESVVVAQKVFGNEAVTVTTLGHFGQDKRPDHLRYGTAASLKYWLPTELLTNPDSLVVDDRGVVQCEAYDAPL